MLTFSRNDYNKKHQKCPGVQHAVANEESFRKKIRSMRHACMTEDAKRMLPFSKRHLVTFFWRKRNLPLLAHAKTVISCSRLRPVDHVAVEQRLAVHRRPSTCTMLACRTARADSPDALSRTHRRRDACAPRWRRRRFPQAAISPLTPGSGGNKSPDWSVGVTV